jgi:hypothetical protein
LHLLRGAFQHRIQMRIRFAQADAFGSHVAIVEAPERQPQALEEVERRIELELRRCQRFAAEPRAVEQRCTEGKRILAAPDERVPVAHRRAQVLGQRLAEHGALRVVPAERQRVGAGRAFVADRVDMRVDGVHGDVIG